MIRILIFSLVSTIFFCFTYPLSVSIGTEKKDKVEKAVSKTPTQRETRMKASGLVREITEGVLVIERNITGELMEFQLEKPLSGISGGDKVLVSYIQANGRNIAKKVIKHTPKPKAPLPASSPAHTGK
ncbi:MAG: hypothetical protein N2572_00735 [Syntrophales bacterium]|nr:hypothetical protein [Syntrophales bacterium]